MILNSIFAIPSMGTVLVKAFTIFVPVDPYLANLVSVFVYTLIAILYIIGIIAIIMNIRSQGGLNVA